MSSAAAGQLATVLAISGFPLTAIVSVALAWYGARHQTWTPGEGWGPWRRGGARCSGADVIYESRDQKIRGVSVRARTGVPAGALDVKALEATAQAAGPDDSGSTVLPGALRRALKNPRPEPRIWCRLLFENGSSVICQTEGELDAALKSGKRVIAYWNSLGERFELEEGSYLAWRDEVRWPRGRAND